MITGYWVSAAIYAAAKLGIADLLKDGAQNAEWLAGKTATHARSLYRVLRALASVGVFAEDADHRFHLTPLADLLRGDVPRSQQAFAIFMGEEIYHCYGDLVESMRAGQSAYQRLYGAAFEYLEAHPDKAAIFDEAMVGIHQRETAAMLDAYDLSGVRVLADVGGGNGSVLCAALQRYPRMQGILFDLPHVVERAEHRIEAAGMSERCRLVGGSFLESVPAGADTYLMRHVVHDWDDARALTILRNVRQVMHDGTGRLLVIENVIQSGNTPALGKLLDLTMLVGPGGQERTEEEFRQLFHEAGLRISRIVPTRADVSVIEGQPA